MFPDYGNKSLDYAAIVNTKMRKMRRTFRESGRDWFAERDRRTNAVLFEDLRSPANSAVGEANHLMSNDRKWRFLFESADIGTAFTVYGQPVN